MDSLIVATAQYVPFLIPLVGVIVWLQRERRDKVALAIRGVVGLVVALVLVKVFGHLHTDPRPFVADPTVKPLFPHSPDNGFPSDHTSLAFTASLLVLAYRRRIGIGLLVVSLLVGLARVAAQVHHLQDIIGGIVIGVLAAMAAVYVERLISSRRPDRVRR